MDRVSISMSKPLNVWLGYTVGEGSNCIHMDVGTGDDADQWDTARIRLRFTPQEAREIALLLIEKAAVVDGRL